jgi:RNA polymerase sigma-70 factor (ECF subfamily)
VLNPPGSSVSTDAILLDRLARGDRAALDELFRRYRGVAFRVAYRLLDNEADALDAVQEGFVKVIRHVDRFGGRCALKTWVLRVVSNAALDLGRQRKRRQARFVSATVDCPVDYDPADRMTEIERSELRKTVAEALAGLPEAQRLTFVLHVEGGFSYREVADSLGVPIGTVMSRLFFARKRLQILLADRVQA